MNLFKKIREFFTADAEGKEPEIILKEISMKNLNELIDEKKKELFNEMNDENFHAKIIEITERIKEYNKLLLNYNLENRRENERVKVIILKNKENLCGQVEKLTDNILEDIEKMETGDIPSNILNIINEFSQKTMKSYIKTTHLIGKEAENVDKSINELVRCCSDFQNKNKVLFKIKDDLSILEKNMKEIETLEINKKRLIEELKEIENNILEKKAKRKEIGHLIEREKSSEEYNYLNNLNESVGKINMDININSEKIKKLINVKLLQRFVHYEHDKSSIILASKYIENPADGLIKDDNLNIIDILKKAKENIELDEKINHKKREKILSSSDIDEESLKRLAGERKILLRKEKLLISEREVLKNQLDINAYESDLFYTGKELEKIEKENNTISELIKKYDDKMNKIKSEVEFISINVFSKKIRLVER